MPAIRISKDCHFTRGKVTIFFFFFFFKNIKTPAGVFYLKANSTVFTKRENQKKETKLTVAIYKISGNYLQGFREFMQIKLIKTAICTIPGNVNAASGE